MVIVVDGSSISENSVKEIEKIGEKLDILENELQIVKNYNTKLVSEKLALQEENKKLKDDTKNFLMYMHSTVQREDDFMEWLLEVEELKLRKING